MRGKITDQDLTNYALNDGLEPSERLYVESMLAISEECRQDIYRNIEMSQMLETGFEGVACEATDFESGVGQFTKSVNVVAPFPWANRSSLARHLAAATASPVARCLPSISMPK